MQRAVSPAAGWQTAVVVAACLLLAGAATDGEDPAGEGGPPILSQMDSMLESIEGIMGFGPRRRVRVDSMTQAEFRRLYGKRMRAEQSPRDIRNEVAFLRLFGLVPDDFDYEETVLDLLSEQAWALYDYKRRRMYLADWAPPDALEFALVHELVHAVDDQHFNLNAFAKGARESEQQLARMAVMEGQASWVMTEWVMRQSDRSLLDNSLLAVTTASATRFEASQFPVYEKTPLYFREVLIFPYTDGLLFQHAMVERFGTQGFRRVFERPPATTQQVLQPDLYLEGIAPEAPPLPANPPGRRYRKVFEGTFGQLDHRILLQHHLGESDRAALLNQWRGSRFEVLKPRGGGGPGLRYAAGWASAEAAREYYHLYRQVCEKKWKDLQLVDEGPTRCRGRTATGSVMLELDGRVVRSLEGLQ